MASSSSSSSSALDILVSCAHAIQEGDLKLADSLLEKIWNPDAGKSFPFKDKVENWFAEALVRRAYGIHPTNSFSNSLIMIPPVCYSFFYTVAGEMVRDAVNNTVMGKKRFHLIDFCIPRLYGYFGSLFLTLPNHTGDPLSVRLSVILPPFLKNTVNVEEQMRYLNEQAEACAVKLEEKLKVVYANSLADVDASMLDLRRTEDEAVVVFYHFKLHRLLIEAKAMERELVKLRQINPDIVIVLEYYANHNDSNFITRFKDCFQYYSNDFILSFLNCGYIGYLHKIRHIQNTVACEGRDRILGRQTLAEWQHLLLTAGFLQVPLQGVDYLYDERKIHEEKGSLVLSYRDRPKFFLSAWKVKVGEVHFNFNQISHKFGQGFNPSPLLDNVVQHVPEVLTLNRVAAFAEIFDMLEDICFKYTLPFALTLTSKVNVNEIMLDPYKENTFFIQNTYFNDHLHNRDYPYVMERYTTGKGQAIVGKAVQSSDYFHYEPSITKLLEDNEAFAGIVEKRVGDQAVVAICLQNHYIVNDVYVVMFCWPATKSEKSVSLALDIFKDLKKFKKKFVSLRVQGTEVCFPDEAISNIPKRTMLMTNPLPPLSTNDFLDSNRTTSLNSVEARDILALKMQGHNGQGEVVPNFHLPVPIHTSSPCGVASFDTPNPMGYNNVLQTQWLPEQIISPGDGEIVKESRETYALPRTKQRKLSSKVWEDFDKFEADGKQVAKCKHCYKQFTGSSKSGTTHLKNHLERCPHKKKTFPVEKSDLTTRDSDERSSMFDQERSRLDFAKMVVKLQLPLDLAEQEVFKNFVKNLQPMFEFQPQAIILSDIHRIYKEEKEKLQQYFNRLACNFSLTIKLWEDNLKKSAYCCLVAHFIDDDWELKMKILAFKTLEHINDIEALSVIIRSSLSEWNIDKKVCSVTVDSSSWNDDMFRQIKENCLSNQGSLPSNHWFSNRTLIEDGFGEIDDILMKLRKSIEYVQTTHGKLKFQEAAQVKLQGVKLMDDLPLRLDSSFGILDSALESRKIFCQLEQIDCNFKVNPSMEEWEKALALHGCLKVFDDILNSFNGTQSLTPNLYFPKLCNIYKKFLQLEKSSNPIVTWMKRKFDHYWSLCNLIFAVAAVLDPTLKFEFVEFSYNKIYGHGSKMQLNRFHKVLMDVYHEYANEAENLTASTSVFGDANDCILDSFRKSRSASNFNEEASRKSDLDCYLAEPLLLCEGAFFDILGWWRVHSGRFPTLGKMARDLLAIPVSSFPPCPDFCAMITNPAYSSLNAESMEALVCSQNWLEIPKGNDNKANHAPTQTSSKSERKMDRKETCVVKISKNWNTEEANSTGSNVKDSSKNDGNPSFDNWLMPQCSSSESVVEKAESMEALVRNRNRLEMSEENDKVNHAPRQTSAKRKMEEKESHAVKSCKNRYLGETSGGDKSKASHKLNFHQERRSLKSSEHNHGRDIGGLIEIPNDDPSFDNNQSEFECSSSESDDQTTWRKQEGEWCKEDVRAYLVSSFTNKENKRLDKWRRHVMSGKSIRDREFGLTKSDLEPLLIEFRDDHEAAQRYWIGDKVVNAFFKLLKQRSDRFPKAYVNHYSFDPLIATTLIERSRTEIEVLAWFKDKKLTGVHKLFLPLCLSTHWVLFYVDTKKQKFSWLDSIPSSRLSYIDEKETILRWFQRFLLPFFSYSNANEWPFEMRVDIPQQKNLLDCGLFVMKYADCLTHGDCFPFTQEDMPHFRHRTFLDIYRGRLHSPK